MLNILFAISIPASIAPIAVNPTFLQLDAYVMLGLTLIIAFILWTTKAINRLVGSLLVITYIIYIQQLIVNI